MTTRTLTHQTLVDARIAKTSWGRRIIRAEARGAFTGDAKEDANNWTTCACGKQDPRLLGGMARRPMDYDLRQLGYDFGYQVRNDNFLGAARTLIAIEDRAGFLLRTTCQI